MCDFLRFLYLDGKAIKSMAPTLYYKSEALAPSNAREQALV